MNTHYEHFRSSDFVTDDAFLKHYLSPTDSSKAFWENWLANHPNKIEEWQEAQKLIEAVELGLSEYVRTYLSKEAEESLLERILLTNADSHQKVAKSIPIWRQSWFQVVAACFILFVGLKVIYFDRKNYSESVYKQQLALVTDQKIIERINKKTSLDTIQLPDGSRIYLSPKSKISYLNDFGNENRTVYLSGKAVFDVVKMPSKPFYVYANELITKVLGTKFEVFSYDNDKDVIVKVLSGKVSVYKNPEFDPMSSFTFEKLGVLLKPNQQVVFSREKELFKKAIVEQPILLIPKNILKPSFVYDEVPVVAILDEISKAYGVEIVFNREIMSSCQLTSSMAEESLQDKLNIICKSIGASYEIIDAQIIINAKACNSN